MRYILILILMIGMLCIPVSAMDFQAPSAPENAQKYLPNETEDFGEGLRFVIRAALEEFQPSFVEASRVCISLVVVSVLIGILVEVSEASCETVDTVGAAVAALQLFRPTRSLIRMGTDTVAQISQYGKLLLPVMTSAMAAQGSISKSGALYAATVFFDSVLTSAITNLLIPLVYLFICLSVGCAFLPQSILKKMKSSIKWLHIWGLKTILYIFTGYIGITGVVGGTTDAAMLKATKLTISGMVPVVGNILSDASEAVLVSAGMMKNAAGIYGLLALIAIGIRPFIKIGVQYLMLKLTAGISETLGTRKTAHIIKDFSSAMGVMLAMTGTVCLMFLISIICFMKGVM